MPSQAQTDILALVPPDFADPAADVAAVRAMMAPFHGHPVPQHVRVTETELGGVRCAWYDDTRHPVADRTIFHCHGGGFVSCPLDDYHFYGALLAERFGFRLLLVDYRLAPEHVYPAAHEDCLAAYRALLQSGADPTRLVVGGDSCGGLLGLATLLAARDEGLPNPACFMSISGWFDLSVTNTDTGADTDTVETAPDPPSPAPDPFLTAAWVRNRGRDYVAGRYPLDDPHVSPAWADPAGLPPLYLPVAQYDTVRHGAWTLAANALAAWVDVTAECWPGTVHGWQGLVSAGVPEAQAWFARAREYLDARVPPTLPS
jgi:monoterpene epsilon-lactone hydrolase